MLIMNAKRRVVGTLRGFDPFMNLVLDDCIEVVSENENHSIGMTVNTLTMNALFKFVNL